MTLLQEPRRFCHSAGVRAYQELQRPARVEVLRDWVRGPPELVIEIASPRTRKRDETIKRRLYERWGVSEYWVVDPEVERIRIYRQAGDAISRAEELSSEANDSVTTPLLPGLVVPVAAVFKREAHGREWPVPPVLVTKKSASRVNSDAWCP